MSAISLKSITGITSITTPAGVDNVFTVHTNDTVERFRIDQTGNQRIAGILTVSQDLDVDGHTNLDNVSVAGVTTFSNNVHLLDNDNLYIGGSAGTTDGIRIFHNGSTSYITDNGTGDLVINSVDGNLQLRVNDTESAIKCLENGAVELYHNNLKKLSTNTTGIEIHANESNNANIYMTADEGDDNGDEWILQSQASTNNFNFYNNTSGSAALKLSIKPDGEVGFYGDLVIPANITHQGDTNTKIRFPGTDTISFETASNERLRITSGGDIGINIASPTRGPLHVHESSTDTTNIHLTNSNSGTTSQDGLTIFMDGNSSAGIWYRENGNFRIATNNSEKFRIDSSGDMGLGTSTIENFGGGHVTLEVAGSTTSQGGVFKTATSDSAGTGSSGTEMIMFTDNTKGAINVVSSDPLTFSTANTERLRIASDGAVTFHTSSGDDAFLVKGDSYTAVRVQAARESNSDKAMFQMLGSRGTNASPTILQSGDTIGTLSARGYDGNSYAQSANIFFKVGNTPGNGDMPGQIEFATSADNASFPLTRMIINHNGIVTKPYQYVFTVSTNGTTKNAGWTKIIGLAPYTSQCTGVSDGTYWSNTNQQFTAPVTGVYHFFVGGWASPNSNGTRYAYSFKHQNGNNLNFIGGGDYCVSDSPMAGWSRTIKLSAGEWVELWGYSAIAATYGTSTHFFFWGGYLLG